MDIVLSLVIAILLNALVLWIVGKLNLGLTVKSYGSAIVAAIVIAAVAWIVAWLLGVVGITIGAGILGAILTLSVGAVVLLLSVKFLSGLEVRGFVGAIIAAIAMGVVAWLLYWVLGLLGVT